MYKLTFGVCPPPPLGWWWRFLATEQWPDPNLLE